MTPFRRFISASGLTNFADGISIVSWGWIATLLTHDPALIALVPVALKAPWFMLSLPAGIIIDRFDRRRLIATADSLRCAAYAAAGIAVWLSLPLPETPLHGTAAPGLFALLAVSAIIVGAAEVLRDNAAQTILPALVDGRDLERANGRLWSVEMVLNNFIGTAAAGVLLGVSIVLPLGVNAAAMALAVALVSRLHGDFRPDSGREARPAPRNWRAELVEGLRHVLAAPILRNLAIITGLFNFAFEAMMVTLVLIVQERLRMGPLALSAIMASGAVGGVVAGLINHRIVAALGRGRVLQMGLVTALALPLLVLLGPEGGAGLVVICAAFCLSEFGGILWNTVSVSYRQRSIPRHLLGRVNSAYRLFALGMVPFGMISAGLLTQSVEIWLGRPTALLAPFAMAGLVFLTASLGWWRFLGRSFPE